MRFWRKRKSVQVDARELEALKRENKEARRAISEPEPLDSNEHRSIDYGSVPLTGLSGFRITRLPHSDSDIGFVTNEDL